MQIGCSLCHAQRLEQSLRLTVEQRIAVLELGLSLRLALIHELRGERYEPKATCPRCGRKLTPAEIIRGFNRDPNDFTTRCPGCRHRFEPSLVCFGKGTEIVLPFFCASQILAQLPGKETLTPEQFARRYPAIFRSAIVHHGGLRQAFAKISIAYSHEEIADWRGKVAAFLGRMPDTVIAECADVTVRAIRLLRRELGVERYTLRIALAEAGVEA